MLAERAPHPNPLPAKSGERELRDLQHRQTVRFGPSWKALSSAAISASLSLQSPAAAFYAACSALEALGIASTEAARVRNASATWRAVALRASAIDCSTSPPLLRADGKSLWPNGE